jgi:hypothetical protein
MNPSKSFTPLLIVIGLLVLLGVSWRVFTPHESEAFRDMRGQEDVRQQVPLANTSKHGAAMMMQVGDIATSTLTDSERADILFVFEEEKMARDIYGVLGEAWGWRTIGHVSRSEQMHMTAVGGLLESYGIPEPKETSSTGRFADKDIQALYDRLVAEGRPSAEAAIKVGLYVEEFDIHDLKTRMAHTDNKDILAVYDYLLNGSYMHLHHFLMRLGEVGGTYTPQILSKEEFDQAQAEGMNGMGGMMGGGRGMGGGMMH